MSTVPAPADASPPLAPGLLRLLDHPPLREIPRPRQIFVNRNTRMSEIEVVGFDMDYTLGTYRLRRIEELSYAMTLERLISVAGYPRELASLAYDHSFVMRGLVVDKDYGNLFKSDRFNHVGRCYHGRHPLDPEVWRKLYRDTKFRVAAPRFAWIDTLFALPEAALYAQIIELLESQKQAIDYAKLYEDIRHAIDEVHRDGTLKARIRARIEDFVAPDVELGPALHKLRSSGKKLFLLTNSLFDYTDAVMSHVLDGRLPEYPSWRNYFDVIVVGAQKPRFFSDRTPFFEITPQGPAPEPADSLERGRVYEGGNLADFERLLKISGDRILYVGDHIYGDILRSKKSSLWRTCMVVEELETELEYTEAHAEEIRELAAREMLRARLDDALNQRKLQLNIADKRVAKGDPSGEAERRRLKLELEKLRKAARALDAEIETLAAQVENGFNRHWGLLFKEGNENSRFGEQIEDYACLYTSRVSNFLAYSPMQYFRAPRAAMAHERAHAKLAPLGDDRL
jgi:HAD superfamily 5'-nucleotidase-like hydrolase